MTPSPFAGTLITMSVTATAISLLYLRVGESWEGKSLQSPYVAPPGCESPQVDGHTASGLDTRGGSLADVAATVPNSVV